MPANVCCPNCWVWSELGSRTTCRRCGAPLILPDGRQLDTALAEPPPPPSPPGFPTAVLAIPAVPFGRPGAALGFSATAGQDWVAICRWITIGYGALCTLALIVIGLLIQHINVPVNDPATGLTTVQTLNIGPPFAIAAIVVGVVFAVFAWLTRYAAARVVFLLLTVLGLLSAVSQVGIDLRSGGYYAIGTLVVVAINVAYGGALVMSLLPRNQPEYR